MRRAASKALAKRMRFGDLAICVNDRIENPSEAGVDRYVGLEHLDPESLRIRRWGAPSDVEATKLLFRKGDIIFGRRRAYQRKLAVADFDGICSAHAMVLRARPEVVLPEFLSFFMTSDLFMDRAQAISVGSLSPTINWKTLAAEEFVLPTLDEQWALLAKCRTAEALLVAHDDLQEALQEALAAVLEDLATARGAPLGAVGGVRDRDLPRGWKRCSVRELCTGRDCGLTLGPFGSDLTVKDYGHLKEGTPVLFVADVQRFHLEHQSVKFISRKKHAQLQAHEALPGDVLVTEMGWPPGEACVVPDDWPPSIIKADIIRARPNRSLVESAYLCAVLNSHWGMRQLVRISPGTTRPRMTLRDFERVELAVPPMEEQRAVVKQILALLALIAETGRRRADLATIKRHLIGNLLDTGGQ